MKEIIKKILAERDSRMYSYYRSVFTEDFELGYPARWDDEVIKAILDELTDKGWQYIVDATRREEWSKEEFRMALEGIDPLKAKG